MSEPSTTAAGGVPVPVDASLIPAGVGVGSAETGRTAKFEMMVRIATRAPPRDVPALIAAAEAIGTRMGADGFYSFPVSTKDGPKTVEGPSIDLVEALREPWGHTAVMCRIAAISGNKVLLEAEVFDGKSGNLTERPNMFTLSSPPGKFANNAEQANRWLAMQFQSAVSKSVRGALEHALPAWYVNAAFVAAKRADEKKWTTGPALEDAIKRSVDAFAERGITIEELAEYLGVERQHWNGACGKKLQGLFQSLYSPDALGATEEEVFTPLRERIAERKKGAGGGPRDESSAGSTPPAAPATTQPALPPARAGAADLLGLNIVPAATPEPAGARRRPGATGDPPGK